MASASPTERERADGLAVFAAASFLMGIGLIAVLERVGAPDAFVRALGPLLALLELSVIGLLTRAPNLLDFLSARRSAPTLYGGLAFAATSAGLVTALADGEGGAAQLPWRSIAVGLAAAAILVGPAVRDAKASAIADVLATGHSAPAIRVVFALALGAAGFLTALAGFELAVDTLAGAIGSNRRIAESLVALTLALTTVPGGFKGVLWSDAACGGGALLIAGIGAGLTMLAQPAPFALLQAFAASGSSNMASGDSAILSEIATAVAIAGSFALTLPAIGASAAGQARRLGVTGLVFAAGGLALAGVALPHFQAIPAGSSQTAVGLIGAAKWLPALALARAGVLGVARAGGVDLATAHSRLALLASRRIALNRLGMLATIALLPWAAGLRFLDSGRAITLALAIGLAFVTPSLLLALMSRAPAGASAAALGAGFLVAAGGFAFSPPIRTTDLLTAALIAGAAGFVAGTAFAFLFPRASVTRPVADPFVDVPLDGLD